MEQFSLRTVFWIGFVLESLKTDCLMRTGGLGETPLDPRDFSQPVDAETREKARGALAKVSSEFLKLGLNMTWGTVQDLVGRLDVPTYSYHSLFADMGSLSRLISREMTADLYIYIPPQKAAHWATTRNAHLFGEKVSVAFPSARFDIASAGICAAVGLSTAAVFHLMRALEVGLAAIGNVFDVSLEHRSWGPAIDELDRKIREMDRGEWRTRGDWKDQQLFYSQAISHLDVVRAAWRNHTMHGRSQYTEEMAAQILANVRAFMQSLAERLSEVGANLDP
jgi:hypothetical protein